MRALPSLLIAASLVLCAGGASAQGAAPMPNPRPMPLSAKPPMSPEMHQARIEMRRVCKPETMRLCPGGKGTDKAARHACMKEHRKDFSPACQQAMAHVKQVRRDQKRG